MQQAHRIYAFFGLIASGKSTLAEAWAKKIGAAYLNSDRVRKELAGMLPESQAKNSFNRGIYTPEFTKKTYAELLKRAEKELEKQMSVVLDASYQEKEERQKVRELAERRGGQAVFILCHCPEPLMRERMEIRAKDPNAVSDGRWEIYLKQKEKFNPPDELGPSLLVTIATDKPVAVLVAQLEEIL